MQNCQTVLNTIYLFCTFTFNLLFRKIINGCKTWASNSTSILGSFMQRESSTGISWAFWLVPSKLVIQQLIIQPSNAQGRPMFEMGKDFPLSLILENSISHSNLSFSTKSTKTNKHFMQMIYCWYCRDTTRLNKVAFCWSSLPFGHNDFWRFVFLYKISSKSVPH